MFAADMAPKPDTINTMNEEETQNEIHEMVHAANLTPDQLSELLKMFAEDSAPKPETIQSVTEEETTHEN